MTQALSDLAGIQYAGTSGGSRDCAEAVMRLIQYGDCVVRTCILTAGSRHGLLLTDRSGNITAVKPGFASGYGGTGPSAFSYSLQLLKAHGAEIDEYRVSEEFLERLKSSALTRADLDSIKRASPVFPTMWEDYIDERDWMGRSEGTLWREFPPVIPFAIMDRRLADVVLSFRDNPDASLMTGYRRLEGIVRERTGVSDHGQKLFAQAFNGQSSPLCWAGATEAEAFARFNLFTAVFGAHRNPRAHREQGAGVEHALSELLLLNHLYLLESEAIERAPRSESGVGATGP